jgi:hypothetical protein
MPSIQSAPRPAIANQNLTYSTLWNPVSMVSLVPMTLPCTFARLVKLMLPSRGMMLLASRRAFIGSRQNNHLAEHSQVVMQHAFVRKSARFCECHAEASYARQRLR